MSEVLNNNISDNSTSENKINEGGDKLEKDIQQQTKKLSKNQYQQ